MRTLCRGILLLVVAMVSMTSRAEAQPWVEKLHFEGFAKVSHLSTSGMNLWVTLDNESAWRYEIKSCEVDIYVEGSHLATISLRDKVVIPRRATSEILLPLRFETRSSFALGRLLWRIIEGAGDDVVISYRMRAGTRLFKRNFAEEGIAVSTILGRDPSAMDAVEVLWQMVE